MRSPFYGLFDDVYMYMWHMYLSNGSPMWWIFIKETIVYVNQTKQIHKYKFNSGMRFFEWLKLDVSHKSINKM